MWSADRKLNIEMWKEYTVWSVGFSPLCWVKSQLQNSSCPNACPGRALKRESRGPTVLQTALPGAGGKLADECFGKRMEGSSPEIFFSRLPKTALEPFLFPVDNWP